MKSVCTVALLPLLLAAEEDRLSSGYLFNHFPHLQSSSEHIAALSPTTIELQDGSLWEVSLYDLPSLSGWQLEDPIAISQNHRWFTKHPYRLINQATHTSVEVSLAHTPQTPLTLASLASTTLTLSNGTSWEIAPSDHPILATWAPQDPLLTGLNTGEESLYRHILIHPNTNTCVRATQL